MYAAGVRLVCCCLLLTPSLLAAQDAVVEPGTRVRVNDALVGELVSWDGRQLVLTNASFSESEIDRLEASLGTASNAGKGLLMGLGVGAGVGAVSGFLLCAGDRCDDDADVTAVALLGASGAAAGAIVGLIVGSSSAAERWREIPVSELQVGMMRGGPILWLSFRM